MAPYPAFSCPGHDQPCETRSVTKAGSPHLGRPFYVCTVSPQCKGWFQFADEPVRQPGKRVTVSIGTDVVVTVCTVCTDGGEPQEQLHVEFAYDEAVVGACRGFTGAHYDADAHGWRMPMSHREALQRRLAELQRAGTIRKLQTLQTLQTAPPSPPTASPPPQQQRQPRSPPPQQRQPRSPPPPRSPLPPPPPPLLLPPTLEAGLLPHQRVAVEFLVANSMRGLVADDMGLGKTVTAIALLAHAREWPVLVICPSSVKYNWRVELLRWLPEQLTPHQVQVVDSGKEAIATDARVLIDTYAGARIRRGRGELRGFRAVVCDESHNLKSPEAQQTKVLLPLLRRAAVALLLSGTPALSRPYELWTQASVVAPAIFPPGAAGLEAFGNTYCGGRDDYNKFSGA